MNPIPTANRVSYNVASQPLGLTFGSGDADTFSYDSLTQRMTQYQYTVGTTPQTVTGTLNWNANGTLASLQITDPLNPANTQTCAYSHDDLARLASVSCANNPTNIWGQTFAYDPFGNLTKNLVSGFPGTSFTPTYSTATNRITSAPFSYDANGNTLSDNVHSYTWDAEGKAITADSLALTYDALGRMVEQGGTTQIVYSPAGEKFALMTGQTVSKAFVPLPGGAQAVYAGTTLAYFRHPDWLGSSRLTTTTSQTVSSSLSYAPFGETYAEAGTPDRSFTGQNQDTIAGSTAGLYDFLYRQHAQYGRWTSPDPVGVGAVAIGSPQSWNRYAYVGNNPLGAIDRAGLDWCLIGTDGFCEQGSYMTDEQAGALKQLGIDVVATGFQYVAVFTATSTPSTPPPQPEPTGTLTNNTGISAADGAGSGISGQSGWAPDRGGKSSGASIPTPAEAATKFCEDHGQVASTIRGTNIPITAALSATAGPVNYNTKNEITPVAPAFPWPEWLSFGAGVDVGINVPTGSAPSLSIGVGKNFGVSLYTDAQGKTTGVNLNLGLSIGPPVTVSPGSANACGLRAGG